jgi:hypothetical protein
VRTLLQGRRFTVAGLLADVDLAEKFVSASLLIFRLAPQGAVPFFWGALWVYESAFYWLSSPTNGLLGIRATSPDKPVVVAENL